MHEGTIGILNVGAGDTKLTFDRNNPAECIRSGRIVADMLKRGYALLVEVPDGKGGKSYTRVREFREDVCEYIIADFDPITVHEAQHAQGQQSEEAADSPADETAPEPEVKPIGKSGWTDTLASGTACGTSLGTQENGQEFPCRLTTII